MKKVLKKNIVTYPLVFIFVFFSIWWVSLHFLQFSIEDTFYQAFGSLYGLIALYGACWGLNIARRWGGFHSAFGRSILFFSFGLLFQEIGQLIYSAYVGLLHIEVPYPSIGDLFFYGTIPLYILAILYLAKTSGMNLAVRSISHRSYAIIIPSVLLGISYFVFLQNYEFDWTVPLKVFLDFGVPLGQAIYISLAFITYLFTRGVLGGVMKGRVLFILFALLVQYAADWTFLLQASRGTWYPGGVNDYMYLFSYFLMSWALLSLGSVFNNLKKDN